MSPLSAINKDLYNKLLARLVLNHRMVAREQVQTCWREVSKERDLGQVLIEKKLLDFQNYLRLHNYILKLPRQPNYREVVAQILGQNQAGGQGMETPAQPAQAAPTQQQAPAQTQAATAPAPTQTAPPAQAQPQPQAAPVPAQEDKDTLPAEFRGNAGRGSLSVQVPRAVNASSSLDQILLFARQNKASDVMIAPNNPLRVRRFSHLKPVTQENLSQEQVRRIISEGIPPDQLALFEASGDLEYAHAIDGGGRYRIALVRQRFGWELSARVVPLKNRSFEESGMPPAAKELTKWATGMVLVTGPLGCGKTSSLTTMVQMINQSRDDHIITVEKPVEFVYVPARCQITQREIGMHTHSQDSALRAALRQDPDIIIISELKDINSITLAISAAETGHLVLATMNTANAYRTINRIIDAFPPDEQEVVRGMVSETLRGVISQQLIPRTDGRGMVPAFEVLLVTKAISNLIRKNNNHQIPSAMMSGRQQGMVLLDDSLKQLVQQNIITGEDAFLRASNPKTFAQYAPAGLKELSNA